MSLSFIIISGNYTAISGNCIQADTSGGPVTITLPPSAAAGDFVQIDDAKLTWNAHNLTIARNGLNINGVSSNYTASVIGNKISVVYVNSSYGWSIK